MYQHCVPPADESLIGPRHPYLINDRHCREIAAQLLPTLNHMPKRRSFQNQDAYTLSQFYRDFTLTLLELLSNIGRI